MKNVRRFLKGSFVTKALPNDAELKAHLDKQMDDHFGPEEAELKQWETQEDAFQLGPCAQNAILENILSAPCTPPKDVDMVNLPPHYAQFKIEPIRFAQENGLDFLQANVIKYLVRWKAKNGLEDLAKALRCLEMYIEFVKGNPDWWQKRASNA